MSGSSVTDPGPSGVGSLRELTHSVEQAFRARYSRPPAIVVAAPGRVNLIGEHIDYNDGFVLPMAVERYVVIAAEARDDESQTASVHSVNMSDDVTIPMKSALKPGTAGQPGTTGWSRYVEGVISGFQKLGMEIPSFDAVIGANLPLGSGLSSSAALEVATATLLETLTGKHLELAEKALLCQRAEHRFAGVPCGIMDQFSSVFGKANELMLLDCQSQEIQAVPLTDDDVSILITNSNVKHELVGGEYAERREQCDSALQKIGRTTWRDVTCKDLDLHGDKLSPTEQQRARHVVSEIARTSEAAIAIRNNDWSRVGELMYASHDSLRNDFQVSCDELDLLVSIAFAIGKEGGMIGSRMTGGGFGGSTVSLVRTEQVQSISRELASMYEARTDIRPDCFASRPARGAHVIRDAHVMGTQGKQE